METLEDKFRRLLAPYRDRRVVLSALWFFFLLFAWYLVRPVRESLATTTPEKSLKWVMAATFGAMFLAAPLYAGLASILSRRWLYAVLYLLFVVVFSTFGIVLSGPTPPVLATGLFYVWASFFSLFSVSCFWSFLVDVFSTEEGKKLFGAITACGSLAGILASASATFLARAIGTQGLIFIAAGMLFTAGIVAVALDHLCRNRLVEKKTSGDELDITPLDAFLLLVRSPFLIGIAVYLFFASVIDTIIYLDVNQLMRGVADQDERTQLFATWNTASQILTMLFQALITPLVLRRFGVGVILVGVPMVYVVTFVGLSTWNLLSLALVLTLNIRVLFLSMVAPAREVLFTHATREEKYSAKNLIDTVFVRGGSVVSPFLVDGAAARGWSMETVLLFSAPLAAFLSGVGFNITRRSRARDADTVESQATA